MITRILRCILAAPFSTYHQRHQPIMHNADHLLPGPERFGHIAPKRILHHAIAEVLDDIQVNIGAIRGAILPIGTATYSCLFLATHFCRPGHLRHL